MQHLFRLSRAIDWLNDRIGRSAMWLVLVVTLISAGNAVSRYGFSLSSNAMLEVQWYLYAAVFLLGAAYTLVQDRHVRVDLFYARFSERDKAWVNLLGGLFLLLPWCVLLLWASWNYAWVSYLIGEGSPEPGGLPARYVIKFVIVLGIGLLLLQALAQIAENALILSENNTDQEA